MEPGGQQLQINAVNRDKLILVKKNPEQFRNLIIRVWGWRGYFADFEELFRDHIIQRAELTIYNCSCLNIYHSKR